LSLKQATAGFVNINCHLKWELQSLHAPHIPLDRSRKDSGWNRGLPNPSRFIVIHNNNNSHNYNCNQGKTAKLNGAQANSYKCIIPRNQSAESFYLKNVFFESYFVLLFCIYFSYSHGATSLVIKLYYITFKII
jgi:hypothetical protein